MHGIVDGWPWLAARPWFLGGTLLLVTGGFELFKPAEIVPHRRAHWDNP